MLELKNEHLTATFLTTGAELISLKDTKGTEYLMRDERYWGYTAPHLFPVIGMLQDSTLRHEGKDYPQKRHGFARNMEFQVTSQDEDTLVFDLISSEKTKSLYPFDFLFRVIYTLKDTALTISYQVENRGSEVMPYSVGAHPAFWVPFHKDGQFTDYALVFEKEEHLERVPINIETGLLKKPKTPFMEKASRIPLQKSLFKEDALIFQNLESSYVSLESSTNEGAVRFHFKEFPFLGIWTTDDDAPFLCLEPWAGHADYEGFQGDYVEKEDNVLLDQNESRTFSYTIEIR
ncbi:aldose 1-epimerase family protein [Proteiniclasticum ruminis]|uniref:Galactose mutarotase n=1 Tax=Proteiniclasticum ruminis TaxID=398199 RepID=A0A1I5DMR6_9CLOT|nr:aldose 1-epimerase family protein [Proteiniclasticum ruminis]SFO00466.1 Galactose mutarotase [Proteiniclasticum ruminis]